MADEVWKCIDGYDGIYQISNKGRIRRMNMPYDDIWQEYGKWRAIYYDGKKKVNIGNFDSREDAEKARAETLRIVGKEVARYLNPVFSKKRNYFYVRLSKDGETKTYSVHRLVAQHFVLNPKPEEYNVVNHKDYNTRNNSAENLEWCTPAYNTLYSVCNRPKRRKYKTNTGEHHITKRGSKYIVTIRGKMCKPYRALEDAIKARDSVFNEEQKKDSLRNPA